MTAIMLRPLCWIGFHKWQFTLLFVQEPDYDRPYDHGSTHYQGVCRRCGARDLFRGHYINDPTVRHI